MTHPDPDNELVTNPNDPYHRAWGSGSVTATIVAIVIMVGIIAYGATTAIKTPPNSAALYHKDYWSSLPRYLVRTVYS